MDIDTSLLMPKNRTTDETRVIGEAVIQFASFETKNGKVLGNTPWELVPVADEEHVYEGIFLGYITRFGFSGKLEYHCLDLGWRIHTSILQCKTIKVPVFGYTITSTFVRFRVMSMNREE